MAALILIVLAVGVGYFVSLRVHPLRRCPVCKNTPGRHHGAIYPMPIGRAEPAVAGGARIAWAPRSFWRHQQFRVIGLEISRFGQTSADG
jgi:hypothetical protein